MKSTTILDKDRIVEAAVAGESNKRIAQRYGCTLYDVRTALDEFAAEQLRPSSRAAALALEVNRLDKLMSVFLREAIESRDAAAGTLCCKLSQRKAALLGLDQPQVVRMDMSVVVELYQETSTENLRRVLWELRNPGLVYSREAADREDDPPAADEPDPE